MSAFPYDLDWEIEHQLSIEAKKQRLHSAAPELLEALKATVAEIRKYHGTFDANLFVKAERAIAKAEGKQ